MSDLQPRQEHHGAIGRFECCNWEFDLEGGVNSFGETVKHTVIVSGAVDTEGAPREVVFEGRGKIGQGIDLLLHDLSIKISRILQRRDPVTGEAAA